MDALTLVEETSAPSAQHHLVAGNIPPSYGCGE
jgi:hypothetical protein